MGSYDDTLQRTLEGDLRRMIGNPCFCDMHFLCGPSQQELPASRLLVAARSPVLKAMLLKVGMAETKLARIPLPEIDFNTMRICLEFFYTDTVEHRSWEHGFEPLMMVIAAAKFFFVKRLEMIALFHLDATISVCCDLDACHMVDLTKAYSHGIMLYHAHPEIFLHNVLHRLMIRFLKHRKCSTLKCFKHLSEHALVHLLQNLCVYPVIEYVRFVIVIWWCSSRLIPSLSDGSPQVHKRLEGTLHDCLPWCIDALCALLNAPKMSNNLDANAAEFMKLLGEHLSSYLERLPVNISMMPSSILRDIIEPLNIIPRPMLMTAYRQQAQSKTDVWWDEFGHGDNYMIEREDATVISCNSYLLQGFARCRTFADLSRIVSFHWEVVILVPCEKFRIGLCWGEGLLRSESYNNDPLGDHEYTLALNSDGALLRPGEEVEPYCDAFEGQKWVTIGVHFYMRTCFFSINGKLKPKAWYLEWLSDEKFFLAVSMLRPGRVQIKSSTEDWDMWREKFK